MSSYSGEAAEQVVRMSLEGAEVAVKLAGTGAKHLAILLYAILKDQKKTRGKVRLTNMLRSGKELKVFAVMDGDLQKFCEEAKKYGVLYTVLKDRDSTDGLTDVMVRAEDASKINRIFERFHLTTVDMGSVKAQIEQAREEKTQEQMDDLPPRPLTEQEKKEEFIEKMFQKEEPAVEAPAPNPGEGNATKFPPSGPFSEPTRDRRSPSGDGAERRPSVRQKLRDLREKVKETEPLDAGRIAETLGKTGGKDR